MLVFYHIYFRPDPLSEDDIMIAIFETVDEIFLIARPKKLLFISIDGVVSPLLM
jgi:5'-3' exonuclease